MSDQLQPKKPGPKPKPTPTIPTHLADHVLTRLPPSVLNSIPINDNTSIHSSPSETQITPSPSTSLQFPLSPPSPLSFTPNITSASEFPHSYPCLRAARQSPHEKLSMRFQQLDHLLKSWEFDSLGEFLALLFYNHRQRDGPDPRGASHTQAVSHANPKYDSEKKAERELALHPSASLPPKNFFYAGPCLFTWAVHTVARQCNRQMLSLTKHDSKDPTDALSLRASSNGRSKDSRTISWNDISSFSFDTLEGRYKSKAAVAYFILKSLCAHKDKATGEPIVRIHRPFKPALLSAMSSFVTCLNQRAIGTYALPMAIYHFSTKAHVDETRILCRMGLSASTATAHKALTSMTDASLKILRKSIQESLSRDQGTGWCVVLDNVQEFGRAYEFGIGRDHVLLVGTYATAVRLYDCAPGAWRLQPYIKQVIKNKRSSMTVVSLIADIDWDHIGLVSVAHIIRVLIGYSPELQHLQSELSTLFRTKFAKHPLSLRKTEDFDSQMGLGPEVAKENITWVRGDGGSHASILRGQKHCFITSDNYSAGRHRLSTPEWWHTRKTMLDHTVNSMTKVFEAQVLDCWRVHYNCSEIREHMKKLKSEKKLPSLDALFLIGEVIYDKYFTQQSYERAINQQRHHSSPDNLKFLNGSPWTQRPIKSSPTTDNVASNDNHNIPELDAPTAYAEGDNFTGDRVLANSILFKSEFVLWLEMAYAIPEGDIGRAFEILKVWIIHFAGGSHPNYVLYLLDIYCLIR
ncbi:hypothetical protein K435DRAFT_862398 [Dendrothele bispora CBS 962.96]|uniref:DUF6589 domain-containing protein n=1 Tax=Dendrothele bispora (strain CBS 962.96) TaxID=1314807 RepID=A0A4S8LSM1_DENBC|nr:hypothetical protein K435DRAFT_862398 [Dendrothele bispora CBS 962.96]